MAINKYFSNTQLAEVVDLAQDELLAAIISYAASSTEISSMFLKVS